MNEYLENAKYNFRRASSLMSLTMKAEQIEDALMFFAFGVERCCKAILHEINPLFLLEGSAFENAIAVLYRSRLIHAEREKADREASKASGLNRNILPFKASMLRSAKFSQVVEDNIGAFTKLSDFRGIVAHRMLSDLEYGTASKFLLRHFYPIVEAFSKELAFPLEDCCGLPQEQLLEWSRKFIAEENLRDRLEALFATHLEQWENNKTDPDFVARAKRSTEAAYKSDARSDRHGIEHACPACENIGILYIESDWDVEGSTGEGYITGVYVAGFECRFCELELNDFEEFDYLRMNDRLRDD